MSHREPDSQPVRPRRLLWVLALFVKVPLLLILAALVVGRGINSFEVERDRSAQQWLTDSNGMVSYHEFKLPDRPYASNATNLAISLFAAGSALLLANATFRGAGRARGFADWAAGNSVAVSIFCVVLLSLFALRPLLETRTTPSLPNWLAAGAGAGALLLAWAVVRRGTRRSPHLALPIAVAAVAVVVLAVYWGRDARLHWAGATAAVHFTDAPSSGVHSSADLLYVTDDDAGLTHLARIEPSLIRAITASGYGLRVGGDPEFPLPGWLPLLSLVALAIFAVMGIRRGQADLVRRRCLLLFGLINLYLVWWLVAAMDPPVYREGPTDQAQVRLEEFKVIEYAVFGGLGLLFTLAIGSKIGHSSLTPPEQAGWATLCFALQLGLIAGLYLVTSNQPGNPAAAWIAAYALAASLVWGIAVAVPQAVPGLIAGSASISPSADSLAKTGRQEPHS